MAAEGGGITSGITDWVVDVIERVGEVGVGILIAVENIFPPIPSEVILPFAGFSASRGDINVVLAWLAATVGAVVGAYVLYGIGRLVSYERVYELAGKRWFVLFGQGDLERGDRAFDRYGSWIVLVGRCIPLVRSIVSVPAGMEGMPLGRFTLLTAIGSGVWNAVFIYAGYQLGERYEEVERWVEPVGYTVLALLLLALVVLTIRRATLRRARTTP